MRGRCNEGNDRLKTTGFLVLIAVMAGCSGASSNDSDEGEDSFTCDPGECSGTYLTSYTQLGGDCAPLETQVIRVAGLDDFEGCTERSLRLSATTRARSMPTFCARAPMA